jgi:type IV secretory pathway TrbD component
MKRAVERKILVAKVAGELLFLYGLLAWLDGVVIQVVNPMWLAAPVSHLFPWLRTDTFTILSFIASALGFLMWRLAVELIKSEQNKATH